MEEDSESEEEPEEHKEIEEKSQPIVPVENQSSHSISDSCSDKDKSLMINLNETLLDKCKRQ